MHEKQDCERAAVKRWHEKHGARLKPLRPVYLGDDLFACQPVAQMLKDNGDDFLFTCKETSHKTLYEFVHGAELERSVSTILRQPVLEFKLGSVRFEMAG